MFASHTEPPDWLIPPPPPPPLEAPDQSHVCVTPPGPLSGPGPGAQLITAGLLFSFLM